LSKLVNKIEDRGGMGFLKKRRCMVNDATRDSSLLEVNYLQQIYELAKIY